MMPKRRNEKLVSFFITSLILVLLILSGPAEAFSLDILVSNTSPNIGDVVSFIISLNIENQEILPIEFLALELTGPMNRTCKFSPNNVIIQGCNDFIITQISTLNFTKGNLTGNFQGQEFNFGYGYGYGYGMQNKLSFDIKLNTSNLVQGTYHTKLKAKINSIEFEKIGPTLELSLITTPEIVIYSPENKGYNSRRIAFNLTTSTKVAKIEYMNLNNTRPKFNLLCKNCKEYGFSKTKLKTLNEGENKLVFRALSYFGSVIERNISLFIDSKPPKIYKTLPRRNTITNGSYFGVKYTEENLENIILSINPNISLTNCSSGKNKICTISPDLSAFDNQSINYSFTISDKINTKRSKPTKIFIDTTSPNLTIFSPRNIVYERKAVFNITISESTDLEYFDISEKKPNWKTLCSKCNEYGYSKRKSRQFSKGQHTLHIRATDKAGNSDLEVINFFVY